MKNRFSSLQNFEDDFEFDEPAISSHTPVEIGNLAPPLMPSDIPETVMQQKPLEVGEPANSPSRQKILDAKVQLFPVIVITVW